MLVIVVDVFVFSTFLDEFSDFLVMFDVFVVKYVVFEALSVILSYLIINLLVSVFVFVLSFVIFLGFLVPPSLVGFLPLLVGPGLGISWSLFSAIIGGIWLPGFGPIFPWPSGLIPFLAIHWFLRFPLTVTF